MVASGASSFEQDIRHFCIFLYVNFTSKGKKKLENFYLFINILIIFILNIKITIFNTYFKVNIEL